MKLSCAVLTAAAVEASDYLSHCNPSTFDDELCIRNCQINREVGQTVSREKYGKHNWLYKDLGFTSQEFWLRTISYLHQTVFDPGRFSETVSDNPWIPTQVFGTEGLSNKKVKKTYRNVIQIQSGGECDEDALLLLQNSLMDDSMEIDIMDGPKDMMRSVFIYHPQSFGLPGSGIT